MIKNLPQGWRVEELGKITEIVRNGINVNQLDEGRIPVSRIETISNGVIDFNRVKYINELSPEQFEQYLIHYNDILFSHINSPIHIGKTAIYKENRKIIQGINLLLIRIKNENADYVNYYIKKIREENYFYTRCNKAVNQASIRQSEILKIPLPLPPLPQQEKIVKVLDNSSSLVEQQKQLIKKYDVFLKSKFIEMFGDPITNPMAWEILKLTDIFQIIDGDRGKNYPKQEDFSEKGFCLFLNAKNVTKEGMNLDVTQYISENKDTLLNKGKLKRYDFVITTRGTIGNIGFYSDKILEEHIRINSGMAILRLIKKEISHIYLNEYLKNPLFQSYLRDITSGSAQPQISITNLNKTKVTVPPIELQNKFASIVEKIEAIKEKETQKLNHLETLHVSLMDKAFKGEIG